MFDFYVAHMTQTQETVLNILCCTCKLYRSISVSVRVKSGFPTKSRTDTDNYDNKNSVKYGPAPRKNEQSMYSDAYSGSNRRNSGTYSDSNAQYDRGNNDQSNAIPWLYSRKK